MSDSFKHNSQYIIFLLFSICITIFSGYCNFVQRFWVVILNSSQSANIFWCQPGIVPVLTWLEWMIRLRSSKHTLNFVRSCGVSSRSRHRLCCAERWITDIRDSRSNLIIYRILRDDRLDRENHTLEQICLREAQNGAQISRGSQRMCSYNSCASTITHQDVKLRLLVC